MQKVSTSRWTYTELEHQKLTGMEADTPEATKGGPGWTEKHLGVCRGGPRHWMHTCPSASHSPFSEHHCVPSVEATQ